MPDQLDTLQGLIQKIQKHLRRRELLEAYYDGAKRLEAIGLSLPPEMDDLQVVINWPGMWVDALEERLDVEAFRLAGSEQTDDELWDWWQDNDLDEESSKLHLESMITTRGFTCVGFPDAAGDAPVITVEDSASMAADIDARTRRPSAAVRLWDDDAAGRPQRATLYLPDEIVYWVRGRQRGWRRDGSPQRHRLGAVLVEPFINRARLGNAHRWGETDMRDIMGLSDAACRSITNLQGAQELLAVPQRFVTGASEEDFVDAKTGKPLPTWAAYLGRLQALLNEDARVFQLNGADLRNFTETINFYARMVSGLTGLPAHYLGFTSDNPASADAIRSNETRLVKRAERKQRSFGGNWERTMRLAMLVHGRDPQSASRLETMWRDASTPTYAAKAQAVGGLVGAGILPVEAAWEELGYSPEKRRRLREMMQAGDRTARLNEIMERMAARERQGQQPPTPAPGDPGAAA